MIRSTKYFIGFAIVLGAFGLSGLASYINTQHLIKSNDWVTHTHQVIESLGDVLSALKDVETGQHGFILTGQDRYLVPYDQSQRSIENRLAKLAELTQDNPAQLTELRRLKTLIDSMLDELKQTIELRRQSGLEAAMPTILSDRGKKVMDEIRELVSRMQEREQELLQSQQKASASSARWTTWTIALGIPLSLILLTIAALILTRSGGSGEPIVAPSLEDTNWKIIAARYLFAVMAVILASILRTWLLKLGPMPLFITYYPAVLLVAVVSGGGPGIVTALLSALAVLYYFIPPYGQFAIDSPGDAVALTIFSACNLSLCIVAERLRRSRWVEAFGLAKQQEAEELAGKNEELAQQAEELSQQTEELAQQNEELQSQSEEIQSLNSELTGREDMLRKFLEAARLSSSEESVLKEICAAAKDIFGSCASAVVICESKADKLFIRAQAGLNETLKPWPIENSFPGLVMQEGRTACLSDASLRPDLKLLQIVGTEPLHAALSSPLRVNGVVFGAVTIYSFKKQEWTSEQFSLIEWVSTQCCHILETLRLQDQLRHTAEQNRLLSELLERSEQPFGIGYPDGRLGYINKAFERLTGYTREELKSLDWANVLTPLQWRSIEKTKLQELYSTGEPARYEKEYIQKNGSRVPIELLVHMIKNDQGLPLYYYSFITDITDRKQAEESLRNANAILEQKIQERTQELAKRATQLQALAGELTLSEQRERSRLAKILHDQLQQLLVAAKFRAAMLGRGGDELTKQATKEVESLIDESIAVSRDLTAELSPPILHEAGLKAGLQWLVRRMADKHGLFVDLETEEDGSIPEQMKILLFDSVRELLFNTVKHANTSSATVNVRRIDDHLQVTVSDPGVGFDPATMPAAGGGGIGFGLFSIRERLELMGGALQIQSAPGQGSRFIMALPVSPSITREQKSQQVLVLPEAHLVPSNHPGPGPKIRILLADDHAVVRQGIGNMLSDEPDMEVVGSAADGQEAVELAARLLPDVVLMDMSMPKLNGVEATRIIHNEYPEIRIIGLSMFDEAERSQAMRDAGAVHYITKSGSAGALLDAIRKYGHSRP